MSAADGFGVEALDLQGGRGAIVDPGRVGDWMQTWTGRRFYPLDPKPEDVDVLDVAFALGNMARYNGQCKFYSVAEHSVLVSYLVPPRVALQGLMHDATEAYISDVIRPVKRALGADCSYFKIENAIWELAIAPKFKLPVVHDPSVKIADTQILGLEKQYLHPRSTPWILPFPVPNHLVIEALIPDVAQEIFLSRFCELTGDDVNALFKKLRDLREEDKHTLRHHADLASLTSSTI